MLNRWIEFILFQVAWEVIKLTGNQMVNILNTASSTISNIVYISGALLLAGYMIYRYKAFPNKTFAFPITERLFSIFHINNPDDFPSLNLSSLKRHINLIINNPRWSFNRLIRRITLYRGFDDRPYVFMVEIPDIIPTKDISDFQALINHWSHASLKNCVDDNFRKEVYRKESDADADLSLEKWFVLTTEPNDEVPTEAAQKKYRWILFKKRYPARLTTSSKDHK